MAETIKILYEGLPVDADQMEFKHTGGQFEVLELADGNSVKASYEMISIFKLRGKLKDNGEPIYVCNARMGLETILGKGE
jgi:hypothetical protein